MSHSEVLVFRTYTHHLGHKLVYGRWSSRSSSLVPPWKPKRRNLDRFLGLLQAWPDSLMKQDTGTVA